MRSADAAGRDGLIGVSVPARRAIALMLALAASGGLVACDGGESVGDVVPRETPELLPPGEGTTEVPDAESGDTSTTSTTDTTDTTEDAPDATAAPSTGAGDAATPAPAPAPAAPAPQAAPESGGTAAPDPNAQAAPEGGQTGGFSDFCAQNPGACGE